MALDTVKDRIMIVDDDKRNQLVAVESLEGLAELQTFSTGEEALAALDSFLPNLVLLDIAMPGISGYDVCKTIRSKPHLRFTKVVLVSAKSSTDEKMKGYGLGTDDYVTKPFMPSELCAKAKVYLRMSRAERELDELNKALDKKVQQKTQQLYETQTKLMNAAKMAALGEMAGGVAHEINNPLATIGLLGEQIRRLVELDTDEWKPMVLEMADTVVISVKHIANIVKDLRTFANEGSHEVFKETPLKQIIMSTFNLCQSKFKTNKVDLLLDNIDENLTVYCRPIEISQVLMNLITNSYEAIVEQNLSSRWIKVGARENSDGVTLVVSDSGGGIPETIRDKIFQPLFTTKEIGKGTGLGLSVSQGIIEGHMGTLKLNPESKHTEFVVFLPKNTPNH